MILLVLAFGLPTTVAFAAEDFVLPQRIELEGAVNFRDIGGYSTADGRKVRYGAVYRSDHLHDLTTKDWNQVLGLGIDLVFDLRTDAERNQWPTAARDGWEPVVVTRNYVMSGDRKGYEELAFDLAPNYRTMFDLLAAPGNVDPAVLIHCTAGQDRTGFAVAFLLTALGVDRETILDDYSLSQHLRGVGDLDLARLVEIREFYGLDGDVQDMVARRTDPERRAKARRRMADALEAIAHDYGSVLAYIRSELDVNDEELARLRGRLLQD
ncbi:MAG: tyrosine-protein phosphatase [Pseudomonadales bacterium]